MPLPLFFHVVENGVPPWLRDNAWTIAKVIGTVAAVVLVKVYSSGARNLVEGNMHGKVVMITGGTSGIGARVTLELARKGAQIILLTQVPPSDVFLVEHIQDLRAQTGNNMIYAEQVDLASLFSIRRFATKWIDNAPPRRLDMIVLCATCMTPPGSTYKETAEGIEETWMVNYLANFHLLGILSPAIRAQPVDRHVKILMASCSSYIAAGSVKHVSVVPSKAGWNPSTAYARSKMALIVFGKAYQKHLDSYKRPDSFPMTAHTIFVDPGYSRTPGMRRWLTRGSLWGLVLYLVGYPIVWLLLKSPNYGAQSFLYAALEPSLGRGGGGQLIKECTEVDFARNDLDEEEHSKKLWQETDALIKRTEKQAAARRSREKKQQQEIDKVQELEALISTTKKGKEQDAAQKAKSKEKATKA